MSLIVQAASRISFHSTRNTGEAASTYGRPYGFSVLAGLNRTFLLALAFAGLLQSSPAVPQQAAPLASQATATAGQETKQGAEGILATIIQPGSTNTRPYKVVIHNDGSATAVTIGAKAMVAKRKFPPGTINTKTLRRLLTDVGDVSRIPIAEPCPKPVSVATTTTISYAGRTSGNLQCVRQQASGSDQALVQASEALGKFVQKIINELKIKD